MSWTASGAGSTGGIVYNAISGIQAALRDVACEYARKDEPFFE
jgi:L-alanine-DL-glutamate epimerase-like enolase superfamily enzyme